MVICIGHIGIDTMIQTSVYKNDEWCYLNGEYIRWYWLVIRTCLYKYPHYLSHSRIFDLKGGHSPHTHTPHICVIVSVI